MDGELQRKSAAFVDDLRRDNVLGEFGMEKELADFELLETSPERSPRAISPLHTIEDTEVEEKEAIGADTRKRIPTGKGREFEVQRFKDNRRNALSNVTKQMNKIRPLLFSWKNVELVKVKSQKLDELFIKLQEAHERYVNALTDEYEIEEAHEWFGIHDKDVFTLKQSVIEFLNQANRQYNDEEVGSVRSRLSNRSKHSATSSCSSKTKLIEAKAKAAALEVKAVFLKERQALRMATEELELRQEIAQAKVEERLYEQFELEQNIDGMNDYLEKMKGQSTSTPISSQAISSSQATLPVASVSDVISKDQQGPAVVNSVSTVPKVTPSITPISSSPAFTTFGMNPSAQPFIPGNLFAKTEEPAVPVVSKHLYNPSVSPNLSRRNLSSGVNESTYQEFLNVQKKQTELSEMIVAQQARSELPSHKPPTFSGDVMAYPAFITAFETLIESKVENSMERLYYLDQYTNGKAKELIKGCLQRKDGNSYQEARRLLKKHFGDPYKIASAYLSKISNWPSVKPNDGTGLQEFSIVLEQARNAMSSMAYMNDLNTANVLRQLWEKLPRHLRSKWTERVSKIRNASERMASFNDFCQFVSEQADLATDPIYSEETVVRSKDGDAKFCRLRDRRFKREKGSSFGTNMSKPDGSTRNPRFRSCTLCSKPHDLDECSEFLKKPLTERRNFVKEKGLCFGCYSSEHIAKLCKSRKSCLTCHKKHPTSLHDHSWKQDGSKTEVEIGERKGTEVNERKDDGQVINAYNTVCNVTEAGDVPVSMGIVPIWLYHKDNPVHKIIVYALLDNASGGTFVKEQSLKRLGIEGTETKLLLTTMHGTQEIETKAVEGLVAAHFTENDVHLDMPRAYVRQHIPADRDEIPRPEAASRWPHLQRVVKDIPPYMEDVEIGALIGLNCPRAVRPREVIHGKQNDPYAVRSLLGWHINGPIKREGNGAVQCHRIRIHEPSAVDEASGYIVVERSVKEQLTPQVVGRMFELDFSERENGMAMSQEDREFLRKAKEGIHHREDSHYELPLPFREQDVQLPNNRPQAAQRLIGLKKRLESNDKYRADYVDFMTGIIDKGYARKIDSEDLATQKGKVWYLPHHGVYHSKKPSSIRVVFDCSARYLGESLNDHLLQGPDLTSKLTGVLTRFREERVAFMADIEKMFYQVKVKKADQDFLRFLWWHNGILTKEPEEYCMTVHLFGGGSSPGCSNFALKCTAEDGENEFGVKASETVKKNFYVDDLLKSLPTEEEAIEVIHDVKNMCAKGGFNLTKFVSNSRRVIMSVLPEDRAKEIKGLDLGQDKLPIERVLGVHWCIESDAFKFRIELKDQPCTRRGMLSTISSVYDPLGIIAPVILIGKRILQEICHGSSWDEPVEGDVLSRWENWRSQLPLLETLSIPRCFKPSNFGKIVSAQLHNMSDASGTGYGQCSYLRLVDDNNHVHCSFVIGKARVAPRKTVSIPRLELAAAAVSVRVADVLKNELDYERIEEFYWTDSKVVLGFINNESRRFHVYVANRVQLIRDYTSPSQWRYVESASNPADEGSRGLNARHFLQKSRWIKGPDFLWESENHWPEQDSYERELDPTSPEVKKITVNTTVAEEKKDMLSRLERFSSWQRLKTGIALCMKYKQRLKMSVNEAMSRSSVKETSQSAPNSGRSSDSKGCPVAAPVMVNDLEQAEIEVIKLVQADAFEREIKALKELQADIKRESRQCEKEKKVAMKKTSSLHTLDPFLDCNRVLRVGGRIKKANLSDSLKNPVILPKAGHVSKLIIRHVHEKTQHSGRGVTLNELRTNGYWIINGNAAVQHFISKCVTCRYLRGGAGEQKMADLPKSRVQPAPPFTYSAVDYFGPWYVKEGRKEVKRYGALFTCMASRSIHIEVAHSLDTDSFLQALRRFISRRGPIRELRSDQGTNFVGAQNELKKALKEMDDDQIKAELLKHDIDWVRNPATASNFGGVWERQIRSARNVMAALMREHGHSLDDEALRTLMCEAEAVVNNRPLTVDTLSDPLSPLPLTPSTLLTGKTKLVLPPPGKFQREDVYCKQRWRRVQHIANEFWSRWSKEYLQNLQMRNKWTRQRRNFTEGDVVLLKDSNTCRNQWSLAKVLTTCPDDQGQVRSVTVRTSKGSLLDRPINKLVLLLESTTERPGIPDEEPRGAT